MGIPVLIFGKSGSGKSTSFRNFKHNVGIINVLGKPLPFKTSMQMYMTDNYVNVYKALTKAGTSSIIIDDAGYLMTNQFMNGHSTSGKGSDIYSFYNTIADHFWKLVRLVTNDLSKDRIVYVVMHEEKNDFGDIKPKTIGKLLDEKVCLEGMFAIALRCKDKKFYTQSTENDIAKSPMGMFRDIEIDNDLKFVDDTIREFYDIGVN